MLMTMDDGFEKITQGAKLEINANKKATIKDVARHANVSTATVERALKGSGRVLVFRGSKEVDALNMRVTGMYDVILKWDSVRM